MYNCFLWRRHDTKNESIIWTTSTATEQRNGKQQDCDDYDPHMHRDLKNPTKWVKKKKERISYTYIYILYHTATGRPLHTFWRPLSAPAYWPCPVPLPMRAMSMALYWLYWLACWPSTACTYWWVVDWSGWSVSYIVDIIPSPLRSAACTNSASNSVCPM